MEQQVTTAIVESFFTHFNRHLENDLVIIGAGPSGLLCAGLLAEQNRKVALFESNNAPGGGIWGGGMMMNRVVVQSDVIHILEKIGVGYLELDNGLLDVSAVELASGLIYFASRNGAGIFNNIRVEDVVLRNNRVDGVVINWSPVSRLSMHIDPLVINSQFTLDATGHPAEVTSLLVDKADVKINTETGGIIGEKPMWMESGEQTTVDNTGEVFPGLFASGMAANNIYGGHRMGPIFGGMLLSGEKAANMIIKELR